MRLQLDKPIGDYTFQKPDGTTLRLSEFRGQALVVIFLRHLA